MSLRIKIILSIIFLFLIPGQLLPQTLSEERAGLFIKSLIEQKEDLDKFVDQADLRMADRLGIQYQGVDDKFFISYDIDQDIKNKIRRKELDYTIRVKKLEDKFSKLVFSIRKLNYQKEFFFNNQYLISPLSYYSRNWTSIESKHFRFLISEPTLFNSFCIENLEEYIIKISGRLPLSDKEIRQIQTQKIYYYLCKDEEEIKTITGFHTRGMYNLAYDFIITTFNAHYHELIHLLVNYKLHKLPLYTHPFLQEGFAVAFGGRGGKEPGVILNLGLFLNKSKMLDYKSMLSKKGFYHYDASLTYPASGLYNYFLIKNSGIDNYMNLYKKYSGTASEVDKMKISTDELAEISVWQKFLADYSRDRMVDLTYRKIENNVVYDNETVQIYQDDNYYYFNMKDTLLIKTDDDYTDYKSKKFDTSCKGRVYNGEKYLLLVNTEEISIYNLFTNNLIANYVSPFSMPYKTVPQVDGFYRFRIRKDVFVENLEEVLSKE